VKPEAIGWDYTTFLNIVAIIASALLFWRFVRTGGPEMLRHMEHAGPAHRHH
jgi:hypothetical protein